MQVKDSNCVYCGACKIVCPEEGALELNRTRIRHTEIRSGAWNKALEKLTSTSRCDKGDCENKKAKRNSRKSIMKRFPPEEMKIMSEEPRVGVFVCHCGLNIAGTS